VPPRRAIPLALALLALLAGGCGRSDDREEVRTVVTRFFDAVEAGDGQAACDQLSEETASALESQEQKPCREAIGSLSLEGGEPAGVEVYLAGATADFPDGQRAFLSETRDGWRLSAAGCEPQSAEPDEEPLDCELED
jgi:hypothetical protein